jgi:hypothetical protein
MEFEQSHTTYLLISFSQREGLFTSGMAGKFHLKSQNLLIGNDSLGSGKKYELRTGPVKQFCDHLLSLS